jgi:PAS domain S-box-containing protein
MIQTAKWIRRILRSAPLPWIVLATGIMASVFLYRFTQDSVQGVAQLRFEREASDANAIIEQHLRSYSDVLYSVRALFAGEEAVDRLRFHRFVQALDLKRRYPGFVSINYAALVLARDRKSFEESVRRDTSLDPAGYPRFAIKPPGERPEYYVAVYLEPMAGFEFGFGLDIGANPMAADPERVAATVRMQRDSGKLIASGQPLRVRGGKGGTYLAMRLPVYRNGMPVDTVGQRRAAYVGSVGAAFDVEYLMREAMADEMVRAMHIKLYDAGPTADNPDPDSPRSKRLLFDGSGITVRESRKVWNPADPVLAHTLPIEIAGRLWQVEYSVPAGTVVSRTDRTLPPLVLGGGLMSSLLLFGVLYAMSSSRARALEIANEITRDLRESEAGLAEAQRMAHLGNWALDPQTMRMTASEETWRILGLDAQPADFGFAEFLRRVHEADRAAVEAALRRSIDTSTDCEIEHRVRTGTGAVRWMHTVLHPGRRDNRGRLPGTLMDITPRKLAEEELKASAAQLQALSRRLVDAQEFERRRFSRELHDLVGQNLTALSINLDILKSQIGEKSGEPVAMRLGDSAALLESTTAAIENVMSELRPPMLDDYGLLPALQWYGGEFTRRTGIEVRIQGDERMRRLPASSEIALFRIVQEALNNVSKHARARVVDIKLEERDAHCVVSVCDDGVGFDDGAGSPTRRRPGLGMVTMRERTQAIGGSFHIAASAGRGTRIMVTLPA